MTNANFTWMWIVFGIPTIYFGYRFIHYWYRVFTVDITELLYLFRDTDERFVLGIYGHTSFLDSIMYLSIAMKTGNIMAIANSSHKWMYPRFTRQYAHFIVPGGNTTQLDGPKIVCVCVEGTRKWMPCLKRGYYYLAKNTNRSIVFCVIDFKRNIVRVSEVINVSDDINVSLKPLRELVRNMDVMDYARYPASVTPICLPT